MRVLLAAHTYPPDGIAGVQRVTHSLAGELTRLGDTVSVVARRIQRIPRSWLLRENTDDGVTVFRLVGCPYPYQPLTEHEYLDALFTQIITEVRPDVVHFQHIMDLSPRFVTLAHRYHAAVVMSLHDFYIACPQVDLRKRSGELCDGPRGGVECANTCFADQGEAAFMRWGTRNLYFRRLLQMADRLIAPSQYMATYFEHFGADPARMHIVPNGLTIQPSLLQSFNVPMAHSTLNLAFIGSVLPHKGPHLILEALRYAGLTVNLLLLGQTPDLDYVNSLEETARDIPDLNLQVYGKYDPAYLPILLADIDCVVIPSVWPEAFSLVTYETLLLGVPVLVSRMGALPEALIEGVNGFTFNPDDPSELGGLLRRLAEDEALRQHLRAGTRQLRATTIAQHTHATRAIYEAAIADFARSGGPRPSEIEEFEFLHAALVKLGLDALPAWRVIKG